MATSSSRGIRFRFGLAAAFTIVTSAIIWFGYQVERVRRIRTAIATIQRAGGAVGFDVGGIVTASPENEPTVSGRLKILQLQVYHPVVHVDFSADSTPDNFLVANGEPVDSRVTDATLHSLRAFSQLKSLSCRKRNVTNRSFLSIGQLSELEALSLRSDHATDSGIAALCRLNKLKHLAIGVPLATDKSLGEIAQLTNLRSLTIEAGEFTDNGIVRLAELPRLTNLTVYGDTDNGWHRTTLTEQCFIEIAKLQQLKSLSIYHFRIATDGARRLSNMSGLRSLSLEHCVITDQLRASLAGDLPGVLRP